ncbi:MAG: OadG family protein [Clostridiaceae bacterium]|jgi:Na+-transporting methylmalonyl-CoA/oxaloacetate decarboxylase gamma subunit|nr:OadG family protein [Clostridiaceae bacterium]
MSLFESLQIALFGLVTVFAVLVALSIAISVESKIFNFFVKKKDAKPSAEPKEQTVKANLTDIIPGQLKLIDVDEKTAAMIMAIVSDESQIPLSELNFKYIKAID